MQTIFRGLKWKRQGCLLFVKGNYTTHKKKLKKELLSRDFTITDGRYIGHENDTGFHHYAIDVAKHYEMED